MTQSNNSNEPTDPVIRRPVRARPRATLITTPARTTSLLRALFPGLRFGVVGGASLAGLGVMAVLWWSPMSPVALWRADAALGSGDASTAVARYDAIASSNPMTSLRVQALHRAASVLAIDLDDRDGARARIQQIVDLESDPESMAAALERLGQLYLEDGLMADAASALREAWDRAPDAKRAMPRALEAARAYAASGDSEQAWPILEAVASEPGSHRARALLDQGELMLASGDPQSALARYEEAARFATDDEVRSVARMGARSCLDRLGNLDEALAGLDGLDAGD